MTNLPSETQRPKFSESVWLSLWGIGLLGLALGVTAGVLTGVAIRNLVGDEPIIDGSGAGVFYVAFAAAVLLDVFLLLNFTNLALRVNEEGFAFRYGMFGKSLSWSQISSVEATDYRWIAYGGWGIRLSTKGRRAWSQLGVKRGVVVAVTEGKNQRRYFISSRRADELAEVLTQGIEQNRHAEPATNSGDINPVDAQPPASGSTES